MKTQRAFLIYIIIKCEFICDLWVSVERTKINPPWFVDKHSVMSHITLGEPDMLHKTKLTTGWLTKLVKRGNSFPFTSTVNNATSQPSKIKTDIYHGTDGFTINSLKRPVT